jgi:hypothetical protein
MTAAGPNRRTSASRKGGRSGIRPTMNQELTNQERGRRALPFHPVLFAVAPILFVYAHNGARIPIDPRELLLPIAFSLAVTAVLWTVLGLLFRSATRAAPVVSLFLVLSFSYGHIAGTYMPEIYASAELLLGWAVLMGVGIWLALRRRKGTVRGPQLGVTVLLNAIAVGILAVVLASGVRAFAHRPPRAERASRRDVAAADANYPDIYYIITDSYLRSDVLKSRYNTDNSAFIGVLESLGFFVADRARSNYAWTHPSLASSLNYTYLDSLAEALGPESDNGGPLLGMIQNSRLVDFLRRRGYTIVSFASGDVGTDVVNADVHFAPHGSLTEFQGILLNTTLLRDVFIMLHRSSVDRHRDRVLYALRNLPNAGLDRHPVFVFAHILSPHRPIIFRAPGLSPAVGAYGGQVLYLNTLLEDVVRRILAQSPRPPIIVIQADHGLRQAVNWGDSARSQLLERHAILDAIYLPPPDVTQPPVKLYDSISPVNTFRVILSRYFDTTMALVPDRSYFSLLDHPYRFIDVDRPESYPVKGEPSGPTGQP